MARISDPIRMSRLGGDANAPPPSSPTPLPNDGAWAKNRLALAPLTNQQSEADGTLSALEHAWLVRRARGGFGLVETCATFVHPLGRGFPGQLGIDDDARIPKLSALASAIRDAGALGIVQLHHAGARAPEALIGDRPLGASELQGLPGYDRARAATSAELEAVIEQFRAAALRAHAAGFAGVEIHGAHGYILSLFLSRVLNQRTDAWGGALENRARLIREVARAVRGAVPASFVVGARLSPEDFGAFRGLDLDESVEVAKWLAEDGVDDVHLSLWDTHKLSTKRPSEHPLPMFRAALPADVRIVAAGKIWTREDAEAALARGADIVSVGRAAILDPDWATHVMQPGFTPERGPLGADDLTARDVGPPFIEYLRTTFKGIVA